MDAPEDDLDVKLRKASAELIADFDRSLRPFLRKNDGAGGSVVRSRVRTRETDRLISLLNPFQELPQLLDPHLPAWLPLLADAYLEHLLARGRRPPAPARSGLLTPLPRAICRLLYTFCKIRGEKVVVRFLSNEARFLEPLLAALEDAERAALAPAQEGQDQHDPGASHAAPPPGWTWEERYVVLLWLSHLLLAPFDLATMSSRDAADDDELPPIDDMRWPPGLPSIATRVLPLALRYLAAPGKERDASRAVLVRIAMRRDMQSLGVLDALVAWALAALRPPAAAAAAAAAAGGPERTPYHYIGVLSFLAGVLAASADTSDMDRYLATVFDAVHGAAAGDDRGPGGLMASALARKAVIKVLRAIAVLRLRDPHDAAGMDAVETTIGFLLDALADNDTPVRFAASKALSIVTLRLPEDMAAQVVEAVLESLNRNVLRGRGARRDLSMVDPLEWHGLMLTLSHLLYRRSPPAEQLADIARALLLGLSFERRSTSGTPTGANVRDAACFGIWALARRYTTSELLAVPTASFAEGGSSILQIMAVELVVTACLDPSGNIRRGSSAALQELIGRHPDTVEKGIWVVQTVDYHAVALRSRALQDVALGATKLSPQYGEALLEGLLGWRGVGDADTGSRRAAGTAYGMITAELAAAAADPAPRLTQSVSLVLDGIRALEARQVEERHGLFYSFAAVLDALPDAAARGSAPPDLIRLSTDALLDILRDCDTTTYRKPELIAEAASRLIVSAFPVLQAAVCPGGPLLRGAALKSKTGAELAALVTSINPDTPQLTTFAALAHANLQTWLSWPDLDIIAAASAAAVVLMVFSRAAERDAAVRGWADAARARQSSKTRTTSGHFSALAAVYPLAAATAPDAHGAALVCDAIAERWRADVWTDTRACILQSLAGSELLRQNLDVFIALIAEGLDDYTTTARGDVGSHVRFEAIRATKLLWSDLDALPGGAQPLVSALFLRILRLAAEKLDRVRAQAQTALAVLLQPSQASALARSTFSSKAYFIFLLDLLHHPDWLHPAVAAVQAEPERWMDALLAGLVSSADTGNEDLVIAARAALCEFSARSAAHAGAVCAALARNLRAWQGTDRVLVPTLEVVGFLLDVGVFARGAAAPAAGIDYKNLCLQVQKACYKTGNVRKIESCIRVYAGIADLGREQDSGDDASRRRDGIREARARLAALMFHPWPRIRSTVVDELWGLSHDEAAGAALKSVDWARADKARIKTVVGALGLA